jgi:hypothetical protein
MPFCGPADLVQVDFDGKIVWKFVDGLIEDRASFNG